MNLLGIDVAGLPRRHPWNQLRDLEKQLLPCRDVGVGGLAISVEEAYPDPAPHRRPLGLVIARVALVFALDTAFRKYALAHLPVRALSR
jgi:hypothetical protein